MAHREQFDFVKTLLAAAPRYFNNATVLEVGSLNINGSIREFFKNCNYLGIDVGMGKDVDLVCQGQDLDHPDNTYDTTASCECFEHNPFWAETFANMHRLTKPGGLVFMSCATTGRREHGTKRTTPQDAPLIEWDYYKNLTEADFREKFKLDDMFGAYSFAVSTTHPDLYFYGIKK